MACSIATDSPIPLRSPHYQTSQLSELLALALVGKSTTAESMKKKNTDIKAKGLHVSFFALRALSSAYPSMTSQEETMPQESTLLSKSQNDAPGIMTSDRTRSGLFSATASRASFPLLTPITSAIVRACNKSPKSRLDAYRCSRVSIYGKKTGQRGRPWATAHQKTHIDLIYWEQSA